MLLCLCPPPRTTSSSLTIGATCAPVSSSSIAAALLSPLLFVFMLWLVSTQHGCSNRKNQEKAMRWFDREEQIRFNVVNLNPN